MSRSIMRYFFDVREASGLSPDEEGMECPSTDLALREAARAAATMSEDFVKTGGGDLAIEVRDGDGPVAVVKIVMEIKLQRGEKDDTAT